MATNVIPKQNFLLTIVLSLMTILGGASLNTERHSLAMPLHHQVEKDHLVNHLHAKDKDVAAPTIQLVNLLPQDPTSALDPDPNITVVVQAPCTGPCPNAVIVPSMTRTSLAPTADPRTLPGAKKILNEKKLLSVVIGVAPRSACETSTMVPVAVAPGLAILTGAIAPFRRSTW